MPHQVAEQTQTLPASLTAQLIAYIGNKRRLLPFLAPTFGGLARQLGDGRREPLRFLDPMAGSGSVARLARHLGCTVSANDWEYFAYMLTAAYLENSDADLDGLFAGLGGMGAVLSDLNGCGERAAASGHGAGCEGGEGYIARHFAPEQTDSPRIGRERLFYTAENARFIDAVRNRIDTICPADDTEETGRARRLLISLLLYEASNHANTSGVFKAYHRGYGGLGGDALSRILAPMHLEFPSLPVGPRGSAANMDAKDFVSAQSGDICYLDPPYNSHQYGSNYFMLNTIARWDQPPVDDSLDQSNTLKQKAGIRADWRERRSPFCSRQRAAAALSQLLDRIDSTVIVVSYSGSGLIGAEELADMLSSRGDVELHTAEYAAYRGGRQSLTRVSSGRELAFVVRRRSARTPSLAAGGEHSVARQLLEWRVSELLGGRFVPERLCSEFSCTPGRVQLADPLTVRTADFYALETVPNLASVPGPELHDIEVRLRRAACANHEEEFLVLLALIERGEPARHNRSYQKRLLTCLRKYAHRKYQEEFSRSVERLTRLIARYPGTCGPLSRGLDRIILQAERRFGYAGPSGPAATSARPS